MSIWPLIIAAIVTVIVATPLGVIISAKRASSKGCGVFKHTWSHWQDVTNVKMVDRNDYYLGSVVVQHSRCGHCGKLRARTVRVTV